MHGVEGHVTGLHGSCSGAHDVPWDIKSASLEKLVPPWRVQRQVWSDSLTANHSRITTDVCLFSDIHLSLTHHYWVHKRGLSHIAFRKDYLTRLRVSMSQAAAHSRRDMMSPVSSTPVSTRHARSAEHNSESLRLEDIGPLPLWRTVVSASLAAPSQEDFMFISGVSPERVAIPQLGVAPLVDPDTDLEDELPTHEDSLLLCDSSPDGVRLPGVRPTPPDLADLELEKALLSVSVLPVMVTPLVDPVEVFPVAPSTYLEPPVPVQPDTDPGATSRVSPLQVAADGPILDVFPSYLISPACSVYEPVTAPLMLSLQEDADYRPLPSPATMDQYFSGEGDLLLGDTADLPLLSRPLTPLPVVVDVVAESPWVPRPGSLLLCPRMGCRTCLGRAPLMCIKTLWSRGPLRRCWTACWAASTAWRPMMMMPTYPTWIRLMDYICTIRGYWSMWVHRVGSPAQPNTGVLDAPYKSESNYVGYPAATA